MKFSKKKKKKKIWRNFYNLANENVVLYFNSSQWVCVCLSHSLLINLGKDFIFKFQSYRLLDLMVVNTLGCNVVVGGLGWVVDQDILGLIPTRSSLVLPDTQIWWVESCISGLLPHRWGLKHPTLVRLHIVNNRLIVVLCMCVCV